MCVDIQVIFLFQSLLFCPIICCRLTSLPLSCTLIPHLTLLSASQGCPTGPSPGEEKNRKSKAAVVGLPLKEETWLLSVSWAFGPISKAQHVKLLTLQRMNIPDFPSFQIPSGVMFPKYCVCFVSVAKLFKVSFSCSCLLFWVVYTHNGIWNDKKLLKGELNISITGEKEKKTYTQKIFHFIYHFVCLKKKRF